MVRRSQLAGEIASFGMLAGIGILILIGSAELPPPEYDPLGPAGMPQYIAYILLFLAILRLFQIVAAVRYLKAGSSTPSDNRQELIKTIAAAVIVLAYLMALSIGGLSFPILTFVFLVFTGFTMTNFVMAKLPAVLIIAIIVSFGLTYVFRNVLNVILPG